MSSYFIRRNQRILGPLTMTQALDLQAADRILDTDEISTQTEGPWCNAKSTLTDIQKLAVDNNAGEALKQDSSEPPDIPQEPPPFELDLSNIGFDESTRIHSITSSFDDWVNQDVLALPPERHSGWQTPLEIKPSPTAVVNTSPSPRKVASLSKNQTAGNPLLIYLTIGGTLCCLATLLIGILIGRFYSSAVPIDKKTGNGKVVEEAYPQIATSANGDSFEGSHGKVLVRLNAMGNNHISIDCRSGVMIGATWRSSSMKADGFEILSMDTKTIQLGSDVETVLIVRETLEQYLNAKKQSFPASP